jgi:hypothetical protein
MSDRAGITLKRLAITGQHADASELKFANALNVLYGASNTGKSFALKTIDFMLGSSTPLPGITERQPYDRAWLALDLPQYGPATFRRALAGGRFELITGDIRVSNGANSRQLSARHDHTNTDNVSQFLLEEIGLRDCEIVTDVNGRKRSLSFRDLVRYCIVDETSIQSEISPVLSGQYQFSTQERSIFRLLISGTDDSAVVPVIDPRTVSRYTGGAKRSTCRSNATAWSSCLAGSPSRPDDERPMLRGGRGMEERRRRRLSRPVLLRARRIE